MDALPGFLITIPLAIGSSVAAYAAIALLACWKDKPLLSSPRFVFGPRFADRLFLAMVSVFVVTLAGLSVLRHLAFKSGHPTLITGWDLAQYDQVIWNSLNGHLFENTFILDSASFLGKSFSPILLAFVPLYVVWSDPIVLLVVQAVALGSAVFPIYWFARARIGRPLALVIALAFVLSAGVVSTGLSDFHEISFALPLLAYAAYFLLEERYVGFLVCLSLALIVKEEIAFVTIGLGLYVMLIQRRTRLGLALSLFGAVWALALLQYIIPYLRGGGYGQTFYYFGEGLVGGGGARYAYLGHNLPEIISTVLTRPEYVLRSIWIPEKLEYLLGLLVPFAFVPLIGWEVAALALPTAGYSLLSMFPPQYSVRAPYVAPALPFLFFACVVGLQRALKWGRWTSALPRINRDPSISHLAQRGSLFILLFVASVSSYFFHAAGPFARYFQPERYLPSAHAILGNRLLSSIPREATVVTQQELLAHLSGRRRIYEIPLLPDYRQADYLVADDTAPWYHVHEGYWNYFLGTGYFEIVTREDGYLIARRRTPANSVNIRYGDQMTLLGYTLAPADVLRGGNTIHPVVSWQADKGIGEPYKIAVQIVDGQGHVWASEDREPQDGFSPTNKWEVGKIVGDQYTLRLPPTMPAGEYEIRVGVHTGEGVYLDAQRGESALGSDAAVARMRIEKDKSSYQASELWEIEQRLYVDMQEMRLLGYVISRQTVSPGEGLSVGLYWRARGRPQRDYVAIVQLRDAAGRIAFEQASGPANDTYPTTQWNVGEVLLDWHDLILVRDLAAGNYRVFVLLKDSTSGQALGEADLADISIVR